MNSVDDSASIYDLVLSFMPKYIKNVDYSASIFALYCLAMPRLSKQLQ